MFVAVQLALYAIVTSTSVPLLAADAASLPIRQVHMGCHDCVTVQPLCHLLATYSQAIRGIFY